MYGPLRRSSALGLFAAFALLAACRGSSSVDYQGVWKGTLTESAGQNAGLVCMIHGGMFCYAGGGFLYVLPGVTGADAQFQDDGSLSNVAGESVSPTTPLMLIGHGSGDSQISGHFTFLSAATGTTITQPFELQPYQAIKGDATIPSGHWTGVFPNSFIGPIPAELTMAADGTFHGTSDGCTLDGSLTPIVGESDLFAVQLVITSHSPADCESDLIGTVTETGLAYASDVDDFNWLDNGPGPYYYLLVDGADSVYGGTHALLLEFRVQ